MVEVTKVLGWETKIRQTSVSRMEGERCYLTEDVRRYYHRDAE